MKSCQCSKTVRQNWGSTSQPDGTHRCSFCDGFQDVEQVIFSNTDYESGRKSTDTQSPIKWQRIPTREIALNSGGKAAERVFRYGTIFENVGQAFQYLNAAGAILLVMWILYLDLPGSYKFIGILSTALVWAFGFLQTSLVRGLASYFQMKAAEYLKWNAEAQN